MPLDLDSVSLLSAFLVGLMGGVHCMGMCGGIVTALSLSVDGDANSSKRMSILLMYNAGRIASYSVAGVLMGGIGALVTHWADLRSVQLVVQLIAALFLISMGLYLGGWWMGLRRVESIGSHVWKRIEPLGRRFIPVTHPAQALPLGMIWGWLPCGLVYSVLIWAVSVGSAVQGGLLLLAFGLGTLPNLLLMGVFAAQLNRFLHQLWVKTVAGLVVIGFGVVAVYQVIMQW